MFCDVLTLNALVEYESPVPAVVVAELNCENLAVLKHPKTDAEAVSQVTEPPAYVKPEENVVVATHAGIPLARARTKPFVPGASSEIDPAEDP